MVILKVGSIGNDVKRLQQMLNSQFSDGPALAVDGIFGPKTRSRVVQFQKSNNLMADGIVGIHTIKSLVPAVIEAVRMSKVKKQLSHSRATSA
jgi:peptidoglycan hydrolase-like protein with peptidoglycan-binding domain